ncbi:hypothetical protein [Streptomyces diastatochromogenes]|uniref:Uncharacterized protein n=1 Tax=Streptomyces diastatochromogenes TaxID=42236 RepID=A0A233SCS3_STRDA|nr:hypothetical protein [Streptomyces diastatochromogenes]MCZ0990348.1 hypothetical protein [Streptomyces diastatochromogenes]OXY93466.1 hypothetical protein BEK98_22425 [Streptomyces diastatochromogenes]
MLTSCKELADRHRAILDQYRDEGEVIEDKYADYDEARISTAIEASDHLDTVVSHLADLIGPPKPSPFTLTFARQERQSGEAPTSFVVNAMNLDDAARILAGHPSWHEWYLDTAGTPDAKGADIVYLPEQSHPSLPTRGEYVDLRAEQERTTSPASSTKQTAQARPATTLTTSPPAPAPASLAARTSH